ILAKIRRPTPAALGPDGIVAEMTDMLAEVAATVSIAPLDAAALGVSFGGPYDPVRGVVRDIPNLPDWGGVPLYALLADALPGVGLAIDNDANAAALAEWRFGAGQGADHMLYLTMGTGIGGGIVSEGRLYRGLRNAGGEVGHTVLVPDGAECGCGHRGCLEAYASGPAIARRAIEKIEAGEGDAFRAVLRDAGVALPDLRAEQIVEAARDGVKFAMDHLAETAFYMGWGIANAVSILAPEVVVLGTVATAAGDMFMEPLRRHVVDMAMPGVGEATRVEPAGLGDLVGDYAAIALAADVLGS
ncbi:ROK family protein, partial [Candidatus Poribacteria bacterium]|nr:ROK family protein [Candidatus Poribacteria bacterium]